MALTYSMAAVNANDSQRLIESFIVRLNPTTNAVQTVTPTNLVSKVTFLNTTPNWVRATITYSAAMFPSEQQGNQMLSIPPSGGSVVIEMDNFAPISSIAFQAFTFPVATGTVINLTGIGIPGTAVAGGGIMVSVFNF